MRNIKRKLNSIRGDARGERSFAELRMTGFPELTHPYG
jgi:hypothetical protein